jgi:tetratricopeptide (TPR) repeat protein
MSLLLEALKKAELAKQRAASTEETNGRNASEERATPIMTRERLPDITQPVEILSEDLPSSTQKAPEIQPEAPPHRLIELAIDFGPELAPAAADDRAVTENRESARRLFEVKELEYHPRRPFYLTLTALGIFGVAYGGYVWWQLQPKANYNAQAVRDSQAQAALQRTSAAATATPSFRAAAAAPAPAAPPMTQDIFAIAPRTAQPAAPVAATAAPLAAPLARKVAVPPTTSPGSAELWRPAPSMAALPPAGESAGFNQAGSDREPIAISPASLQVDPLLERAYDAVQKNDLFGAREIYQNLLQRDPNHRDALLGLAAIDLKTRNYETAEARYIRLLEIDPRDSHAQAGLFALRGQVDSVSSESRIKNLLATQPESPPLYFALGNQYALQSRWNEAQQAYFRASTADTENADYAFNLAVSLDHLRQKGPALEHYRRSLALADKRPGSFDRSLAAARIQQLQK